MARAHARAPAARAGPRRLPPPPRARRHVACGRGHATRHAGATWAWRGVAPRARSRRHAGARSARVDPRAHARTRAWWRRCASVRASSAAITSSLSAHGGRGLVTITAQLEPEHLARAESGDPRRDPARPRRRRDAESSSGARSPLRRSSTSSRRETAEGRARACGQAETVWRLEDELAVPRPRADGDRRLRSRRSRRRYLDPERYVRVALRAAGR